MDSKQLCTAQKSGINCTTLLHIALNVECHEHRPFHLEKHVGLTGILEDCGAGMPPISRKSRGGVRYAVSLTKHEDGDVMATHKSLTSVTR